MIKALWITFCQRYRPVCKTTVEKDSQDAFFFQRFTLWSNIDPRSLKSEDSEASLKWLALLQKGNASQRGYATQQLLHWVIPV